MPWWADLLIGASSFIIYLFIGFGVVFPFFVTREVKSTGEGKTARELAVIRSRAEKEAIPLAVFWPGYILAVGLYSGMAALYHLGQRRSAVTGAEKAAHLKELEKDEEIARSQEKAAEDAALRKLEKDIALAEKEGSGYESTPWSCCGMRFYARGTLDIHLEEHRT
jgi:hypothetical protein